ncbi:DNA repair protein, partial [Trichinella spiralis]
LTKMTLNIVSTHNQAFSADEFLRCNICRKLYKIFSMHLVTITGLTVNIAVAHRSGQKTVNVMGVKGLWKILDAASKPVTLESLSGKILAVDLSIWLHQAVHVNFGSERHSIFEGPKAHLQILFFRLLKLLFYGIRPIIVFDGPEISILKKRTQIRRRIKLNESFTKSRKLQQKMLKVLAAKAADRFESTINENMTAHEASSALINAESTSSVQDIEKIERLQTSQDDHFDEDMWSYSNDEILLDGIDLKTVNELPLELQYEIYAAMKSQPSKLNVPSVSGAFSNYQINELLKRNEIDDKLAKLREEIILSDPLLTLNVHEAEKSTCAVKVKKLISRDNRHHIIFDREEKTVEDSKLTKPFENLENDIIPNCVTFDGNECEEMLFDDFIPGNDDVNYDENVKFIEERPCELFANCKTLNDDLTNDSAGSSIVDVSSSIEASEPAFEKERYPSENEFTQQILSTAASDELCDSEENKETFIECQSDDSDSFVEVEELSEEHLHDMLNETLKSEKIAENDFSDCVVLETKSVVANDVADIHWTGDFQKLESEHSRAEAGARTVTSQILDECEVFLRLFGVPIVKSLAEAEAQCAWLEQNQISEGTITDDSDIWLFGGQHVYRNLFVKKKLVQYFDMNTIKELYALNREKFILLAMLVGCDYSQGVENLGVVTALEIIAEFNSAAEQSTPIETLVSFRQWFQSAPLPGESTFRTRLRKLCCHFPGTFPDQCVYDAFLNPKVNHFHAEDFKWNLPDLDAIRRYAEENFNWSKEKTDQHLLPVMKKLGRTHCENQSRISSHFLPITIDVKAKQSKRMKVLINKMKRNETNDDVADSSDCVVKKRKKQREMRK